METVVRNPEITVVNKTGDKFGFLGWRVGQKDQGNIKHILEDATSRLLLEETKVEEKQTIFSGNETRTQEMEDHLDETQKKFEECKRNGSSLSESLQKIMVEQKANDLENQTILPFFIKPIIDPEFGQWAVII